MKIAHALLFGLAWFLVACDSAPTASPPPPALESPHPTSTPAPTATPAHTAAPTTARDDCALPAVNAVQLPALPSNTAILLFMAQPNSGCLFALDAQGNRLAEFPSPVNGGWKWDGRARILALHGYNDGDYLIWNHPFGNRDVQRLDKPTTLSLFDYVFAPDGQQLVYLAFDIPATGPRVWRLTRLDIRTQRQQTLLEHEMKVGVPQPSDPPLTFPKAPFDWSPALNQIFLYGIVPNTDAPPDGVWSIKPDGSDFRLRLPREKFVGRVALSPDGRSLAYFAYDDRYPIASRWRDMTFWLPTNQLRVMDLVSGEDTTLLAETHGGVLRYLLLWAADRRSLLVAHNAETSAGPSPAEWLNVPVDGASVRVVRVEQTRETTRDITTCPNGDVLYVLERDNRAQAIVRLDGQDNARNLLALAGDRQTMVRLIGCLR